MMKPAPAACVLLLAACAPLSPATQAKVERGAVIVDIAACDLQKAANLAGDVAFLDAKIAAIAQATSVASGLLCTTLAAVEPPAVGPGAGPTP